VELKATSLVIGNYCYGAIHRSDARVELAFFFACQWWSQGLATEGLRALLHFGFEELGLNRMEARCMRCEYCFRACYAKTGNAV